MRTLFVSDLDGTLLDNTGRLNDWSRERLKELLKAGLAFTVASARSRQDISHLLEGLDLSYPPIALNGAMVGYLNQPVLLTNSLESDFANIMDDIAKSHAISPFWTLHDNESGRDHLCYTGISNQAMNWFVQDRSKHQDGRLKSIKDLKIISEHELLCASFMGHKEQVSSIREHMERHIPEGLEYQLFENRYNPGDWWLSVQSDQATKGNALGQLRDHVPEDRIVVFGDAGNDRALFEQADHAVAVSNAESEILDLADERIASNEENAVVEFLSKMI
jgi:Cof subfamily protein (haloacid dehalogenase superfamily)